MLETPSAVVSHCYFDGAGHVTHGYCLTFEDFISPELRAKVVARRRAYIQSVQHNNESIEDDSDDYDYVARQSLCILSKWPYADLYKRYAMLDADAVELLVDTHSAS